MTKTAFWISLLMLLAAGVGCRPMSTARYTGPLNPLTGGGIVQTQPMAQPQVVRAQNAGNLQGSWQGYNNGAANPPRNTWPATTNVQPVQGGAPAQPAQAQAQQLPPPEGYVGGSIPVHGTTRPMNFTPASVTTYQNPPLGQSGEVIGVNPNEYPSVPVDVYVEETETGRFMFGVGVNSDAGVTGQIVIDERNFDLFRPPRRFGEILDGTAFRGGGQGLRIEAVPGDLVQRYVVNFTQPYLCNTNVSFNVSGFFYDRRFEDWTEQRLGGRIGLGYRLTPDLSLATSLRAEKVDIRDPRLGPGPPYNQLTAALGEHNLFSAGVSLTYDTRDIPFNPSEGQMFELSFDQAFGSYDYPKIEADYRRYFLVAQRPDTSGRHVLAFQFRAGVTGSQTPIYENFFAGGFSTLRGFNFRGASPVEGGPGGVKVGGEFMFLGSVEYRFPLTQDDMLHGVAFIDYGTVEEDVAIRPENYRVAPGFGLRIAIPAMGPAPIALDFAFPIASAALDEEEVFSFFVGLGR